MQSGCEAYLNGAEGLCQEVLELGGHDKEAGALVVLLQDLADSRVCQQAPLDHQQQPSMQVDKASVHNLQHSKGLGRSKACGAGELQPSNLCRGIDWGCWASTKQS